MGDDKDAKEPKTKRIELGRCGSVTLFLAGDRKRLLIGFDIVDKGFDKAGLNGFIEALRKVRDKMDR
jgi:hypothetical protein